MNLTIFAFFFFVVIPSARLYIKSTHQVIEGKEREKMPSIDVDVASVPDIIEAQLTLSYSRLTDLIRVIVDQGNAHEDDIDEIRDRLAKLVQENNKLRSEIEALKQCRGPDSDVAAAVEKLKSTVKQLSDKVDANAAQMAAVTAAQSALAESVEKQAEAWQAKLQATVADHVATTDRRLAAMEKSMQVVQAFTDLWGGAPEQVLEMGRRNANQEIEHSLKDRTMFLFSMPAFVKMHEELEVLRTLIQRQAADALAAKTSEAARTSRTASLLVPQQDGKNHAAEVEELTKTVRTLELQVQVVEKQRLPPLETALSELQRRGSASERVGNTEKNVDRLYDQLGLLEDRLNTLLGMPKESNAADVNATATNLALVDLARRVSMLEGTVEGIPRRNTTPLSVAEAVGGAGGEVVSADGSNGNGALPFSSRGMQGRPPSGRLGNGSLPNLTKDMQSSSSGGGGGTTSTTLPTSAALAAGGAAKTSPTPRRSSSLLQRRSRNANDLTQPTVEALRRQETAQPAVAAGGRRISVAVEPDDGLRRRVAQLEENTAVLEVNKADRKELQQLEAALRHALSSVSRPQSDTARSSPSLIPQRPMSAGGRFVQNQASSPVTEFAQVQRGDSFVRPASASGALGRPKFVGSSSSVFLHDGAQLTNATVTSTGDNRV